MKHSRSISPASAILLSLIAFHSSRFAFSQCPPGTLMQSIPNPAPAAGDYFGRSVAISGNMAVIGAPYDETGATQTGTAYVLNATTGDLTATLTNPAPATTDAIGDEFGISVAIDGYMAVVGARRDDPSQWRDTGTAYVFNATSGALTATLNNPWPEGSEGFGYSVAIAGNVAIVGAYADDPGGIGGAGTAYVFNATTGDLTATLSNPAPAVGDYFGNSVAISGNLALVGALYDNGTGYDGGTAYVFDATTGSLVSTLNNPAPSTEDYFGYSVAISGNMAVVGAVNDDPGAYNVGTAYVFNATSGALTAILSNPAPAASDYFGYSVAISGNVAVVGAVLDDAGSTDAGTAYVFNATTGNLSATLNNPYPSSDDTYGDQFGNSVAISGNVAMVGAAADDAGEIDAGSAYVFNLAATHPAPQEILPALLGQAEPSPDLEANCDGALDIADLLRALLPNPQ